MVDAVVLSGAEAVAEALKSVPTHVARQLGHKNRGALGVRKQRRCVNTRGTHCALVCSVGNHPNRAHMLTWLSLPPLLSQTQPQVACPEEEPPPTLEEHLPPIQWREGGDVARTGGAAGHCQRWVACLQRAAASTSQVHTARAHPSVTQVRPT